MKNKTFFSFLTILASVACLSTGPLHANDKSPGEKLDSAIDSAKEKANDAKEKAKEVAEAAKEKIDDARDSLADKIKSSRDN